jgi:xanthine dehydrogenase accessory factor
MMRPVQQTAARVTEWLQEGRRVAAGTLVAVDGSSPLDVGASVYIDEHGTIEGSVTGGCVESAVAQEAMAMLSEDLPPKLVTYGISDELAGTVGLMCGGIVHIFIHVLPDDSREAMLAGLAAIQEERPAALATLLDGEHAGAKLYVEASGSIGTLGGPALLDSNAAQEARGLTIQGRSTVRAYGPDGASLGSGLRVHVAAFAEPPRMVIFGAIDFASALAPLAKGLGYRVVIADPRRAFLDSPRFSSHARTMGGWPADVLAELPPLGPRDAVLVFTHDPKLDVPAVIAALGTDAGYIGALGSRRTTADRNERLREAGVDAAGLARVYAPCGLDIGSSTVEETAVAILGEIIAARAERPGKPLREGSGPIRRDRAEGNVAEGERRGTSQLAWQAKPQSFEA